jgi:hypothetical protein
MKPREKKGTKQERKRREKQRIREKNQIKKRRKDNITLSQKSEKGSGKKTRQKAIKGRNQRSTF